MIGWRSGRSYMLLLFRDFSEEPAHRLKLDAEEVRHVKARRLKPGDSVAFGDGRGRRWAGTWEPKNTWLRNQDILVEHRDEPERVLYTALPEGKRWDWLLQKATELGVTRIQPVNFRRSVRREINHERAAAVIAEAAGQSRRYQLPVLQEPLSFARFVEAPPEQTVCFWLHFDPERPSGERSESTAGNKSGGSDAPAGAIIGPEGGFEREEVDALRAMHGVQEIQLGWNVMRIETAAVAILARFLSVIA